LREELAWIDVTHVQSLLLFLFADTSVLAAAASEEILFLTIKGLAFRELLASAFVGLARCQATAELQLLLRLLRQVLIITLGCWALWLSWFSSIA
jgi:hypothetical protein